jgi:hypothetical protein
MQRQRGEILERRRIWQAVGHGTDPTTSSGSASTPAQIPKNTWR